MYYSCRLIKAAVKDVEEMIRESGSKAAFDLGIHDLAEPLLEVLGKLRFRTSYGQNLLAHSKEVGLLAGMMAEMLDLDPRTFSDAFNSDVRLK